MKYSRALVFSALLMTALSPLAAQATTKASPTHDLNLRSGPSTRFPPVTVLLRGSNVYVHGCIKRFTWCDVSAGHYRGWVSAAYLNIAYRGRSYRLPIYAKRSRIPVITFEFGSYWDDNYGDYEFYDDRDEWDGYSWQDDGVPPGWRDWDDDGTKITIEKGRNGKTGLNIEEQAECTYESEDGSIIPLEGCTIDRTIPLD